MRRCDLKHGRGLEAGRIQWLPHRHVEVHGINGTRRPGVLVAHRHHPFLVRSHKREELVFHSCYIILSFLNQNMLHWDCLTLWHIPYLGISVGFDPGTCVKSCHTSNPRVSSCQDSLPGVNPVTETDVNDICRATVEPMYRLKLQSSQWPPGGHQVQLRELQEFFLVLLRWWISKCLARCFCQIEFLKQTDEFTLHCLLLSSSSSAMLSPDH